MLPQSLQQARDTLEDQIHTVWDADASTDDTYVRTSPLGQFIAAFGTCTSGSATHRRLAWLALFVARRAVPCWELYCDGRQPHEAIEAVYTWLTTGRLPSNWEELSQSAVPRFRGLLVDDCRWCDTSCAAQAAAEAVHFVASAEPLHAVYALSAADVALDQSPLGGREDFRRWLLEMAVPIAYAERDMTPEECNAYRDFDPADIPRQRLREHGLA